MKDRVPVRRAWAAGMLCMVIMMSLVPIGAQANHREGGSFPLGHSVCTASPDCLVFRQTCDDRLAKKDGITSSQVNISDVKGTRRTFRATGTRTSNESVSRVYVEFWNSSCIRLPGGMPGHPGIATEDSVRFDVPSATKWIVVYASNVNSVEWTMT